MASLRAGSRGGHHGGGERRGLIGVVAVGEMGAADLVAALTDVVAVVADDLGPGGVDSLDGLAVDYSNHQYWIFSSFLIRGLTWVAKDDHTSNLGRHLRRHHRRAVVHELAALRVPGHDDGRVGAVGDGLLRQGGHFLGAVGVAAGEEAGHVGGVLDALDLEVAADLGGERLEEGRAGDGADVAALRGAAGEDDDHVGARAALQAVLRVA